MTKSTKLYYSLRTGNNLNAKGFEINLLQNLFLRLYKQLDRDGYFTEAFGFYCVDNDFTAGKVLDPKYDILLKIRKENIWPIEDHCVAYSEDDLFDVIEFLFECVSKPIDGNYHSWNQCGMHWETFNQAEGQKYFRKKINEILDLYVRPFTLSPKGEVLHKPEKGLEKIFEADIPTDDENIQARVEVAIIKFQRHGSSLDDRRQAVRDLADVLEYLRPKLKLILSKNDEIDLFNIANNFGIRHCNERQKTDYDTAIWLSWMFYFYLSTIHTLLRKIENVQISHLPKQS
jgi:hypothetical protein